MYCGNCGNELDDGAAFCTKCGEKAPDIAADETVVITPAAAASASDETVVIETAEPPEQPAWQPAVIQQTKQMPVTPAPAPAPAAAPAAGGHKKKRTALVIAVACLVVVAIIGITAWLVIGQKMQAKRAPHPISFTIQAEGYNDQCTKIPVSVKGVDFEGNQVDDVAFVDASGSGVELVKGEYDLSFPASPLTPDGVLYNVPTNSYHVAIGEDLEEGVPFDQPDKTPAVFSKSTAYGETDEMIASAYDYAIMDESQADRAEELKAVATRVHGDAVAAEEQRKAAEAARTVDMKYYTLKLPEYWVGKVDVIRDGNNVQIVPKGYGKDCTILYITFVPSSEEINAGDYMGGMLKHVNTSGGRAEMWATRYPGLPHAITSYGDLSKDALATAIDLQTGGATSLAKIEADHSANQGDLSMKYAMMAAHWLEDNVQLTAK